MIVDTSALIAILRYERDWRTYAKAIKDATDTRISAANYFETAAVVDSCRDPIASRRFDDLITEANIIIEPVTAAQSKLARAAYKDFGKGSGHPAKLNFGDCFAYSLARAFNDSLLFKGHDFSQTDITSALD